MLKKLILAALLLASATAHAGGRFLMDDLRPDTTNNRKYGAIGLFRVTLGAVRHDATLLIVDAIEDRTAGEGATTRVVTTFVVSCAGAKGDVSNVRFEAADGHTLYNRASVAKLQAMNTDGALFTAVCK